MSIIALEWLVPISAISSIMAAIGALFTLVGLKYKNITLKRQLEQKLQNTIRKQDSLKLTVDKAVADVGEMSKVELSEIRKTVEFGELVASLQSMRDIIYDQVQDFKPPDFPNDPEISPEHKDLEQKILENHAEIERGMNATIRQIEDVIGRLEAAGK